MARPLRIEFAGGLYHVTSRGDRREDIFAGDDDRVAWLGILGTVCERFNWTCHAYCLMTNHYHVVVETVEGNLAKGMRQPNGVFTQYVTRRHERVGHVFPRIQIPIDTHGQHRRRGRLRHTHPGLRRRGAEGLPATRAYPHSSWANLASGRLDLCRREHRTRRAVRRRWLISPRAVPSPTRSTAIRG